MNFGYKKAYINGTMRDESTGKKETIICPATEEVVAEIAFMGEKEALEAVASAKNGFKLWSGYAPAKRREWMLKLNDAVCDNRELLQNAVMYESGKTWEGADEDVQLLSKGLTFYADECLRVNGELLSDYDGDFEHQLIYEPVGPVAAFLAWNFPLLNLGYKLGPILSAGCSIIVKPSRQTPLSAYIVGYLAEQIGFPKGVINILCGPNATVSTAILKSPHVAAATLIGSTGTGKKIIEDSLDNIKRFSMELGGNAPVLVFEDSDVEAAADLVANLKFGNTGQICVAPNRVFCQESVYPRFKEALLKRAKRAKPGFGRDSGVTMGPMIDPKQKKSVEDLVQATLKEGGVLLFGGPYYKDLPEKGYYHPPTIFEGLNRDMTIFKKEIFGPVIALYTFTTEEEALDLANDTDAGLASYLFTNDSNRIYRLSRALEFGEVMVNGCKWDIYLPHIGIKQSGMGMDCSRYAMLDYMHHKRISIKRG